MDLIKLEIPADFALSRTTLSWRDVKFGIDHELLAKQAVVDVALQRLATANDPSNDLIELATAGSGEWPRESLDSLANAEPEASDEARRDKWLYLALAWIFENRAEFEDPLQTVEEVYADFEYPESVAPFVRYMPAEDPATASEANLYAKWQSFLESQALMYR